MRFFIFIFYFSIFILNSEVGVFLILCSLLFGGLGVILFFDFGLLSLFNVRKKKHMNEQTQT